MADILQIKNVSKKYSNHVALNDVSLNVAERSVFGLLGPNGAGKTSLIRIINQITGPDTGEILFKGEKLNPKHVERIGYLPEESYLYRFLNPMETLDYYGKLFGLERRIRRRRCR